MKILKKGKKQDIPNEDLADQEENENIKMHKELSVILHDAEAYFVKKYQ